MFIFALSGCADTAPVVTGDHPSQPTVEITLAPSTEPTGPVESEVISFSAGNAPLAQDSTATACWDNPITAGAHCTYLERDLQSRLNRYASDGTILDVWIWAEPRTDGSYDLYIGYA